MLLPWETSLEFSRDLGAFKRCTVPGDGACLWHTLCALASADDLKPQQSGAGIALKRQMTALRATPIYTLDWSPSNAWADAGAIPSTVAHYNRNALVINVQSQSYVYNFPDGARRKRAWVDLLGTTTAQLVALDPDHLPVVSQIPLKPWSATATVCGGGISLDPWHDIDLVEKRRQARLRRPAAHVQPLRLVLESAPGQRGSFFRDL